MAWGVLGAIFFSTNVLANEVNIYASRQSDQIKPALDKFTQETGIKTTLVSGNADDLLQRLLEEGDASPADILLTTDLGRLSKAKSLNLFQSVVSADLITRVPSYLKDQDMSWYGLSLRARPIFYAKGVVDPTLLKNYSDLADPRWKSKVCMRSSRSIYNQSLVASILRVKGVQGTQAWLKGLVGNFAGEPSGSDIDQLRAIADGECQITVANTYYFGQLINSSQSEDVDVVNKIGLLWPNQENRGVHVNVSGAGVLKTSKNKENAIRLIEYLTSDDIQKWYAEVNHEFPVISTVESSELFKRWGQFKVDEISLSMLGDLNAKAVKLMQKSNWK